MIIKAISVSNVAEFIGYIFLFAGGTIALLGVIWLFLEILNKKTHYFITLVDYLWSKEEENKYHINITSPEDLDFKTAENYSLNKENVKRLILLIEKYLNKESKGKPKYEIIVSYRQGFYSLSTIEEVRGIYAKQGWQFVSSKVIQNKEHQSETLYFTLTRRQE
jgi:hypothetical protein